MKLSPVDVVIMVVYFAAMIGIGIAVTRRAAKSLDSYFLAGNSIPWYILGASNASAMFDIAGTMWLVYNTVVYGLKGAYLPWLWPTFNQVIFMVFLASWLRRSNVLTGAAWITTRFGEGRGGELARIIIAFFALVSVVGFTAYAFAGVGKFAKTFLPWDLSADTYAVILMSITAVYVILGGMLSVIITDLAQFVIMVVCSFAIAFIAMSAIPVSEVNALLPADWYSLWVDWRLGTSWGGNLAVVNDNIYGNAARGVAADGYSFFGLFFIAMLFKGVLVSIAGPAPNYDMQRILAARTGREASLMSGVVSVALIPRWFMIAGIALIGLYLLNQQLPDPTASAQWLRDGKVDLEMLLPIVIKDYIPPGLVGLLLAGLLAAFMSTFSATLNAGAAYLINDVYKRYVKRDATTQHYVYASYIGTALILVVGIAFGMVAESVNQVTQWIVNALFGGYAAPNVLKWYWWRFNARGYFWGMLAGVAAALFHTLMGDSVPLLAHPLAFFPVILLASTAGSVIGSLTTEPDDREVLKSFYRTVRPWGFWGPIAAEVIREDPSFEPNRGFWRDAINCLVAVIWQFQLVTVPIFLVFQQWVAMSICLGILVATSIWLKLLWYDKLDREDEPRGTTERPA